MTSVAKRDLSTLKDGNPTQALHACYQELMAEECPARLAADAKALVRACPSVSDKNKRKFSLTVDQVSCDLTRLKGYITNFVLAGCGLAVV